MTLATGTAESSPNLRNWIPYYTGVVAAFGFSLLVLALFHLPADRVGITAFAAMAVIAEFLSVELYFRSRSTVSVSGIVAVASILVFGPLAGTIVFLATSCTSVLRSSLIDKEVNSGRADWFQRLSFNMGMWMIASVTAGGVYLLTGGTVGAFSFATDFLPLIALSLSDIGVNLALLIGVIVLQTGRNPWAIFKSDFRWTVPIILLGNVVGGATLAVAYDMFGLLGIAITYLPVIATGYSFRLYTSHTRAYVKELETLNARMEQAYADLQEADLLKDGLLRNITHELRTPLAILAGYIELMRMDEEEYPEEQREILLIAAQQADQVNEIVREVTAIHQGCEIDDTVESLDLVDLVQNGLIKAREEARRGTGERPNLDFSFQSEVPTALVVGSRNYLNLSINAMLSNAVKFSPHGGRIEIKIASIRAPHNHANVDRARRWVELRISDQGIGIPQDVLNRVWDRFFQADVSTTRRFGGTGLGLSLVKETVEAHGGAAYIESEVDKGTTIYCAFPLAEQKVASAN